MLKVMEADAKKVHVVELDIHGRNYMYRPMVPLLRMRLVGIFFLS